MSESPIGYREFVQPQRHLLARSELAILRHVQQAQQQAGLVRGHAFGGRTVGFQMAQLVQPMGRVRHGGADAYRSLGRVVFSGLKHRVKGLKIFLLKSSKIPMKLILILILLVPVLAWADPGSSSSLAGQNATLRDAKGRASATARTSGGQTTFRDAQGRMTGTATTSSTGLTTFRDAQGRKTGSSSKSGSKSTCRDAQGRITGTSSRSASGVTTYRDASGRITGTSSLRGNTLTFRDAAGRPTESATVKK